MCHSSTLNSSKSYQFLKNKQKTKDNTTTLNVKIQMSLRLIAERLLYLSPLFFPSLFLTTFWRHQYISLSFYV